MRWPTEPKVKAPLILQIKGKTRESTRCVQKHDSAEQNAGPLANAGDMSRFFPMKTRPSWNNFNRSRVVLPGPT
jgi:hypothetical protein